MKIMSINAGSSSLKFSLFDMSNEEVLISGVFERIGIEGGTYTLKYNGEKITEENLNHDYSEAYKILEVEREKSKKFLEKALDIEDNK